jgi:hypothetical protein
MSSNMKGRLIGLFILVLSIGGIIYNWHSVLTRGLYWQKASFLFPFFACLGFSLILYPITKAESLAKYGSEQIPWKHIPTAQKLIILLGVVLGALQLALFAGYISL